MKGAVVPIGVVALLLGATAPAAAHELPDATGVAVDDGAVAVRTERGLVVRDSESGSFRFVCHEGYAGPGELRPSLSFRSDGTLLATSSYGPRLANREGCGWRSPGSVLDNRSLGGMVEHPTKTDVYFVVGTTDAFNGIFRSEDGGESWDPLGTSFGDRELLLNLAVANDAQHFYVSGSVPASTGSGRTQKIWYSSDAGASWSSTAIPNNDNEKVLRVLGVAPEDPERVFAVMLDVVDDSVDRKDRLFVSTDGGASFEMIHKASRIRGFASSPETDTIWLGTESGLLQLGPESNEPARVGPEMDINCARYAEGRLWACGDGFGGSFALGVSDDGGKCFESVFAFKEVQQQLTCPGNPDVENKCGPAWEDWYSEIVETAKADGGVGEAGVTPEGTAGTTFGEACPQEPADAGVRDAGGDAGSRDAAVADATTRGDGSPNMSSGGGCDCHATGGSLTDVPLGLAFALGMLAMLRRRRRRGRCERSEPSPR